ncbi:hypothetical protein OAF05_01010 [bacterium]|nr:hypothetical protein [bacterium]
MSNNINHPAFNLVAGMSRGGTNLVWTALASTEYDFITKHEVNQLLSLNSLRFNRKLLLEAYSVFDWYISKETIKCKSLIKNPPFTRNFLIDEVFKSTIDWIKLGQPAPNKLGVLYKKDDILKAKSINLKMVSSWYHNMFYGLLQRNNPLKYFSLLDNLLCFSNIVLVVRHPFAQAEAWMRRGCSQEMALRMYIFYASYYLSLKNNDTNGRFHIFPLSPFLLEPNKYIQKIHNTPQLTQLRIAKKASLTDKSYKNTLDKKSSLVPLIDIQNSININIDDLHINQYRGPLDSPYAIRAISIYQNIVDVHSL